MFPFLRFGFLSLCTGTFLKAYLSLSSHFPEAEEHLKLRLCKYCLKSFLRAFLSPSEYFPRAEPLRSFTETFLSLHQENLLRFSRSTLPSGVLSLFTYILAPSVYFVNSFFEDFIFYLYILFSQNEAWHSSSFTIQLFLQAKATGLFSTAFLLRRINHRTANILRKKVFPWV